jgi:hypothetical protein
MVEIAEIEEVNDDNSIETRSGRRGLADAQVHGDCHQQQPNQSLVEGKSS